MERQLLALLPANGKRLSSVALAERLYENEKVMPMNARVIVGVTMRTITKKLELMPEEKRRVRKSPRRGPVPIEFWLEKA